MTTEEKLKLIEEVRLRLAKEIEATIGKELGCLVVSVFWLEASEELFSSALNIDEWKSNCFVQYNLKWVCSPSTKYGNTIIFRAIE